MDIPANVIEETTIVGAERVLNPRQNSLLRLAKMDGDIWSISGHGFDDEPGFFKNRVDGTDNAELAQMGAAFWPIRGQGLGCLIGTETVHGTTDDRDKPFSPELFTTFSCYITTTTV